MITHSVLSMRRIRSVFLAAVLALTSAVWVVVPAAASSPATAGPMYYVALGDSLSVGWQPFPDEPRNPDGSIRSRPTDDGYPNQLFEILNDKAPALQLVKFGCPGETTATMLRGGGYCTGAYQSGKQLTDAVAFIKAHPGQIAYLSIDIGANDVFKCVLESTIDQICFNGGLDGVKANLDEILETLRQGIKDSGNSRVTKAAGMTYYNPTLAYWPVNPLLATVSVGYQTQLNVTEAALYLRHGFRVAPVASAFKTFDFRVPRGASKPTNVQFICDHTWACKVGDIHANAAGYKRIADTFAQTLRW